MPARCVIGHRGAPKVAPENSLAGFRAAHALGAAWVETDVALLGDGTAVICHDADLQRIAGIPRKLDDLSRADLDDPGLRDRVPTLDAALALFREIGLSVNLEIKTREGNCAAVTDALLRSLDRIALPVPRLLISSFDPDALELAGRQRPDLALGLLCEVLPDAWRETARRLGLAALHPNARRLDAGAIAELRIAGLAVNVWTVNDPALALDLWGRGASGIITDDPRLMLETAALADRD